MIKIMTLEELYIQIMDIKSITRTQKLIHFAKNIAKIFIIMTF